jgi:ATP-dependent Clp protease ATP-binding subunit ClpC
MKNKVQEELKTHFRPEFLNRVDDIIVFHQLEREEIFRIVDLMIAKVDDRLKDRDMSIELRPAAKDLLRDRGYDPVLGARPLRRTIQREIEDSLSEKILFGELRPGQIVIVDVEGSGETAKFTFTGVAKPEVVVPDAPAPEIASEPVATKGGTISSSAGGASAQDGGTASALG